MEITKTARGFAIIKFADTRGVSCSIQESSSADTEAVWIGVDEPRPIILATDAARLGRFDLISILPGDERPTGWVDFPIPNEVSINTRMLLTREQVEQLLPVLKKFVEKGWSEE